MRPPTSGAHCPAWEARLSACRAFSERCFPSRVYRLCKHGPGGKCGATAAALPLARSLVLGGMKTLVDLMVAVEGVSPFSREKGEALRASDPAAFLPLTAASPLQAGILDFIWPRTGFTCSRKCGNPRLPEFYFGVLQIK